MCDNLTATEIAIACNDGRNDAENSYADYPLDTIDDLTADRAWYLQDQGQEIDAGKAMALASIWAAAYFTRASELLTFSTGDQ